MMRKWLNSFKPTPRVTTTDKFAVLPQQSEGELAYAEVSSKLDRALCFLQHDVGYTLLSDARLQPGGTAKLKGRRITPGARLCGGDRLVRNVKEEPESEDDSLKMQALKINPSLENFSRYAHYPEDLMLVQRFAAILGQSSDHHTLERAEDKVTENLYKLVLQGVQLLHLCDYHYADVVLVLAHATVYFRTTFHLIGHQMSEHEAAHVCVLLIYLAHTFLLDETCPLRCWQNHIFRKYCSLKVLDAALFRLFKMRGYKLRITPEEEREALFGLSGQVDLSSPLPRINKNASESASGSSSKDTRVNPAA